MKDLVHHTTHLQKKALKEAKRAARLNSVNNEKPTLPESRPVTFEKDSVTHGKREPKCRPTVRNFH